MTRVLDCFFLSDELDLLEAHLRMLEDVVDVFVIVEGDRTFAGEPRRSAFAVETDRFSRWRARIDHVVVPLPAETEHRWDRENAQRAGLGAHLDTIARDGDLVLLGDVDEIVAADVVRALHRVAPLQTPVRLCLDHASWYADWILPRRWTNGPIAFHPQQRDDPIVRLQLGDNSHDRVGGWGGYVEQRLTDAGVHLWNVLPPAAVRRKWTTYSHAEHDRPRFAAGTFVELCRAHGVTADGRWLVAAIPPAERSTTLRRLAQVAPDLFSSAPLPAAARREEVAGYAWCRSRLPLPAWLWAPVDRWPWLVRVPGPALRLLTRSLWRRRRTRPVEADDRWRSVYLSLDDLAGAGGHGLR